MITPARLLARIIAPVVREIVRECREPALRAAPSPAPEGLPGTTASQVELGDDGVRVRYGFGVTKADTGVPRDPGP
jgi:hypothetical protein